MNNSSIKNDDARVQIDIDIDYLNGNVIGFTENDAKVKDEIKPHIAPGSIIQTGVSIEPIHQNAFQRYEFKTDDIDGVAKDLADALRKNLGLP